MTLALLGWTSNTYAADPNGGPDFAKMWKTITELGGSFNTAPLNPTGTSATAANTTSIPEFIGAIIDTALIVIVTVGLVGAIYGGFKMIYSAAAPDQYTKGFNAFKYSLLGIAVAFLSFIIIRFVDAVFK